jgi:hypothetical protein
MRRLLTFLMLIGMALAGAFGEHGHLRAHQTVDEADAWRMAMASEQAWLVGGETDASASVFADGDHGDHHGSQGHDGEQPQHGHGPHAHGVDMVIGKSLSCGRITVGEVERLGLAERFASRSLGPTERPPRTLA